MAKLSSRFVDDVGFLGSSLRPEDTGVVGAVLWVFSGEFSLTEAWLGPRILVVPGRELRVESLLESVPVTITSHPELLGRLPDEIARQAVAFAAKNADVALRYWRGELDTGELLELLAPV